MLFYRIRWWLLALLVGIVARPAAAQVVSIRSDSLLAQVAIHELQNDQTGFIWVAARQGLFRFDGQQLVPLNQLVQVGPRPEGNSLALATDAAGRVWFSLDSRLFVFQPATGQLRAVPLPPNAAIETMHVFQGALWIGGTVLERGGGNQAQLIKLPLYPRPGRPQVVRRKRNDNVCRMAPDSAGALRITLRTEFWHVTADGRIASTAVQGWARHREIAKSTGELYSFAARPELRVPGTRWVLGDSTLAWLRPDGKRVVVERWRRNNSDAYYPVQQILELDSTWYWPGKGEVLALSLRRHPAQPGLRRLPVSINRYATMLLRFDRDTTGIIAYGRNATGVVRLRPLPWAATALPVAGGLQLSTRTINRLSDGRLVVGTYSGTFVQAADSPNAPLRRWAPPGYSEQSPPWFDSTVLPDGRLLVADMFGNFELVKGWKIDSFAWHQPRKPYRMEANCVLRTRDGQLWGGGQQGLYSLDLQRMRVSRYRYADPTWPLHQSTVYDIAEGAPGELWLATQQGLYWLRTATGELRRYSTRDTGARHLPADLINCVLIPHPDSVWLGTMEQGLLLLHPQRGVQQQLTTHQGLPSAAVAFLSKPAPGRVLWIGTYNGLIRYDLRSGRSVSYTVYNGLPDNELNRYSVYYDERRQELYVGSIRGICRLPVRAVGNLARPQPRLLLLALTQHHAQADTIRTDYLYNALPGGVHLLPGDAFASVQVGLSSYSQPGRTQFAYRLLGPTRGRWHELGSQPWIQLLGLEPGNYTLEVRAQTAEGLAVAKRLLIPVAVSTYWWRRPGIWALIALVLAAATGAGGVWWQRRRTARREAQLAAEAALRNRLAADLHDEIGSLLTRVTMRAELLEARQNTPQLAALVQESRSAAATVRDIIWSVDADADTVEALLDRLRDLAENTRRTTELHVQLHLPPDGPLLDARLRPAVRQHVYLICKESVTNALRHGARRGELIIRLDIRAEELLLEVINDTCGSAASRSSQGLRSMQTRANAIGGALRTGPQPEGHWQVHVKVPKPLAPFAG